MFSNTFKSGVLSNESLSYSMEYTHIYAFVVALQKISSGEPTFVMATWSFREAVSGTPVFRLVKMS